MFNLHTTDMSDGVSLALCRAIRTQVFLHYIGAFSIEPQIFILKDLNPDFVYHHHGHHRARLCEVVENAIN